MCKFVFLCIYLCFFVWCFSIRDFNVKMGKGKRVGVKRLTASAGFISSLAAGGGVAVKLSCQRAIKQKYVLD